MTQSPDLDRPSENLPSTLPPDWEPPAALVKVLHESGHRSVQAIADDPQPGDIYEGSWGYDQTKAEFWQVIKRTPATVTIRRLATRTVGEGYSTRLMPNRGDWLLEARGWTVDREEGQAAGEPYYDQTPEPVEKVCRLGRKSWHTDAPGARLFMKSYYDLHPWDGEPAYDTLAAGLPGH